MLSRNKCLKKVLSDRCFLASVFMNQRTSLPACTLRNERLFFAWENIGNLWAMNFDIKMMNDSGFGSQIILA